MNTRDSRRATIVTTSHLAITAVLAAINLSPLINSWTVEWLFKLNAESNVAVWFSSTSLLALAAIAFATAARSTGRDVTGWTTVGALFVFLSLDETARLHELVGLLFSARVATLDALPDLYAWVAVLAPVALVVAAVLGRWLLRHAGPGSKERRLVLGALGCWVLVPVAEVLDPALGAPAWLMVIEESLELVGLAFMLGAFLRMHSAIKATPRAQVVPTSGPTARAA